MLADSVSKQRVHASSLLALHSKENEATSSASPFARSCDCDEYQEVFPITNLLHQTSTQENKEMFSEFIKKSFIITQLKRRLHDTFFGKLLLSYWKGIFHIFKTEG